jgi:hypothetical protein
MKTLALVLGCALPLIGQSPGSPSDSAKAAAIVARHTAAVGGAAAFRALKHLHTVTTASMSTPGTPEVRTELYAKAPNLVYMKMDMPGIGPMEMGFDGKIAWSNSAVAGPTIHDDMPAQMTSAANFAAPPLDGLRLAYAGRRQIGARSYDAIKASMPDGQSFTHYFDVETGLLAGMDPEGITPPPNRMTLTFDDYKRFGAVLQATKVTTVAQGQEIVMRTVSISYAPFDAKIFDPPRAVLELRNKPPER